MARIVPSSIGISYCLPVRLSVIVSVSAMRTSASRARAVASSRRRRLGLVRGSAGSRRAPGSRPSSQRARSASLQRSLQNGRHAGSTGWRRQYDAHAASAACRPALLYRMSGWHRQSTAGWPRTCQLTLRPASPAWCRTSLAETMKMTSSAMFVAWSPIRSRWREIRIRSSAGSMVRRVLQHVGQQLAEDLRLQRVELVVLVQHALRQRRCRGARRRRARRAACVCAMSAIRGMSMSSLTGGCCR